MVGADNVRAGPFHNQSRPGQDAHRPALVSAPGIARIGTLPVGRRGPQIRGGSLLRGGSIAILPEALAEALRDRYELLRELGRGGMATVWLAHDLQHDRPVALK